MSDSSILSKVIHLKEAQQVFPTKKRDINIQVDERREDPRTKSDERLFIQIVESQDQHLHGTTVSCKALDVSASGLRIQSGVPIPKVPKSIFGLMCAVNRENSFLVAG